MLAAPPANHTDLDAAVAAVQARKDAWARLPMATKIGYLAAMRDRTAACAADWVAMAARAKGLRPDSPLAGEEWLSGPWAVLHALNRLIDTLRAIERHGAPQLPRGAVRVRPDGQTIARVFPQTTSDGLLLSGISAEVWMEPGVTPASLPDTMAGCYRRANPDGAVALILGAGNIAAIGPLDPRDEAVLRSARTATRDRASQSGQVVRRPSRPSLVSRPVADLGIVCSASGVHARGRPP